MNHVRRQLTRLLGWAVLLVLGALQVAHAQGIATGTRYYSRNAQTNNQFASPPNPFSSAQAACAFTSDTLDSAVGTNTTGTANGLLCTVTGTNQNGTPFNPYSYTITTDTGPIALPCPEAGTKKIINVTAGYVTSANGSADVLNLPSLVTRIGQNMCAAAGGSSCTYTIGPPVDSWSSTQPTTTGLYRISDDWEMTATGGSCTPTAEETAMTDATAAPPACPGASGTVNGKPVCVPTTGGSTSKPASSTTNRAGNPAAGSEGTNPIGNSTYDPCKPATSKSDDKEKRQSH